MNCKRKKNPVAVEQLFRYYACQITGSDVKGEGQDVNRDLLQ